MAQEFRILSLSGGGVRGVFQARFLASVAGHVTFDDRSLPDLVAATSTGAIVGLALTAGVDPGQIMDLYRSRGAEIFKARSVSLIRKGGRFDANHLRHELESVFGSRCLGDLSSDVLVATSVVNTYEGRIFSTFEDADVPLVDVLMATTAAPTYFPPSSPSGHDRGYMDGGLWANDPSYLAVHWAIHRLGIDATTIKLLSLGTGRIVNGALPNSVQGFRMLTLSMVRFIYDFTAGLQSSVAESLCDDVLERDQQLRINPQLRKWIPLDNVKRSLETLPAKAESEFEKHQTEVLAFFSPEEHEVPERRQPRVIGGALAAAIHDAGLNTFIPNRYYYSKFGGGRESISSYIALAKQELVMVSINLATGDEVEVVTDTFDRMVRREHAVKVHVSLLDPECAHLLESVAPALRKPVSDLKDDILRMTACIVQMYEALPASCQDFLNLSYHLALPSASAILIDSGSAHGVLQLETKAYRAGLGQSFGFEVRAGTGFHRALVKSYERLVADGRQIL